MESKHTSREGLPLSNINRQIIDESNRILRELKLADPIQPSNTSFVPEQYNEEQYAAVRPLVASTLVRHFQKSAIEYHARKTAELQRKIGKEELRLEQLNESSRRVHSDIADAILLISNEEDRIGKMIIGFTPYMGSTERLKEEEKQKTKEAYQLKDQKDPELARIHAEIREQEKSLKAAKEEIKQLDKFLTFGKKEIDPLALEEDIRFCADYERVIGPLTQALEYRKTPSEYLNRLQPILPGKTAETILRIISMDNTINIIPPTPQSLTLKPNPDRKTAAPPMISSNRSAFTSAPASFSSSSSGSSSSLSSFQPSSRESKELEGSSPEERRIYLQKKQDRLMNQIRDLADQLRQRTIELSECNIELQEVTAQLLSPQPADSQARLLRQG